MQSPDIQRLKHIRDYDIPSLKIFCDEQIESNQ